MKNINNFEYIKTEFLVTEVFIKRMKRQGGGFLK